MTMRVDQLHFSLLLTVIVFTLFLSLLSQQMNDALLDMSAEELLQWEEEKLRKYASSLYYPNLAR